MQWNDDARAALAKAPFFVRGTITRRVEEYVRKHGREIVALSDITELRASHNPAGTHEQHEETEWGGMSADQIEKIVRGAPPRVFADERTYEVRTCGSPDCPRSIFDVRAVAGEMVRLIEESGVPESVVRRVSGPVLRHHMLLVSVSGCLNSCSQPQIADFGVQGRARPVRGPGGCTGCGKCVSACSEGAVSVSGKEPTIIAAKCVDCGDCAAVCEPQALVIEKSGFSVLVGGKLGRKPKLARTLFDFADEEMLRAAFRVACEIFAGEMQPKERLADAVDRIGLDAIGTRAGASVPRLR